MRKSEIFAEILSAVSRETEVTEAQILSSCKHTEAVDARAILAKLLAEQGFYPVQTAASMHRTASSIRYLLAHYEERSAQNKMMENYAQNIRKQLKNR